MIEYLGHLVLLPALLTIPKLSWNRSSLPRTLFLSSLMLLMATLLDVPIAVYYGALLVILSEIYLLFKQPTKASFSLLSINLALYLGYSCLSLAWSVNLPRGLHYILDQSPLLMGLLGLHHLKLSDDERDLLIRTAYRSVQVYLILVLVGVFYTCHELQMSLTDWPILKKQLLQGKYSYDYCFRCFSPFIHPSFHALISITYLLGGITLCGKNRIKRWDIICSTIMMLLPVLFSQSRVGIILWMFAVYTLIMHLLYGHRKRQIGLSICVAVLALLFGIEQHGKVQNFIADENRSFLYHQANIYIHQKPWSGSGVGGNTIDEITRVNGEEWYYFSIWQPDHDTNKTAWNVSLFHPHNQWITEWMMGGFGLFFFWTLFSILFLITAFRRRDYFVMYGLLCLYLVGYIDAPLLNSKGLYLLLVFLLILRSSETAEVVSKDVKTTA